MFIYQHDKNNYNNKKNTVRTVLIEKGNQTKYQLANKSVGETTINPHKKNQTTRQQKVS
jgi:hypothetical protein